MISQQTLSNMKNNPYCTYCNNEIKNFSDMITNKNNEPVHRWCNWFYGSAKQNILFLLLFLSLNVQAQSYVGPMKQHDNAIDFSMFSSDTVHVNLPNETETLTFKNIENKTILIKSFISLITGTAPSLIIKGYARNSQIIGDDWQMNSDLIIDCPVNNLKIINLRSSGATNAVQINEHKHSGILEFERCALNNTMGYGLVYMPKKYNELFFIYIDDVYFGNIAYEAIKIKKINTLKLTNSYFFNIGLKNSDCCAIATSGINEIFEKNDLSRIKKQKRHCIFFDY